LIPLLTVPITDSLLERADRLKVVANYAVGFDNIDLDAASRRGIWVTNTPGVLTDATADLTWAIMLALVRKVIPGHRMISSGGYHGWGPTMLLGLELSGKTLGIVGFGKIGRAVARRAAGFGMQVLFYDHTRRDDQDLGLLTALYADLESVLTRADIISLHTPLNDETFHLIDARRLALMKPSAVLVNTSRGPVIDEQALVRCLQQGKLGGAALDVYEREPLLAPGLAELENVVLLPHLGSATQKTRRRMANLAAENVDAVLAGRIPPNAVNKISG
jgi:glyoxylate reductase